MAFARSWSRPGLGLVLVLVRVVRFLMRRLDDFLPPLYEVRREVGLFSPASLYIRPQFVLSIIY